MSKARDIRHHDEIQDRLDILQAGIATLIDYHEQANNQRVAASKDADVRKAPGFWQRECESKDALLSMSITNEEKLRTALNEARSNMEQTLAVKKLLADERATLAKRVSFLEAACDEWAEKCRKDYDNMGAQIRTLQTGMDNWQKEAGRNYDRAQAMETDRDLWQARCNNACQKLSELDTDNRYNGIQVDCDFTRCQLDLILKDFLNRKKAAVHAHG